MSKLTVVFLLICLITGEVVAQKPKTKNLLIVTLDGFRWKDLYRGADENLFTRTPFGPAPVPEEQRHWKKFGQDSVWKVQKYWGADIKERREKLMPFFWNTIAKQGQLHGNRDLGSLVNVKNKHWSSYPGYNEMFTGYPDPLITNSSPDNPHENVLEFLNRQPGYQDKVAVFASWDAYNRILNQKRSGLLINSGWADLRRPDLNELQKALNIQQHYLPKIFGTIERLDASTYAMAREFMKQEHPRILYLALIDTDAFAHRHQYDYYLDAAHNADAMISDLWNYIQSDPFYKDQTTLIVTTDHGRGDDEKYSDHGSKVPHADEVWLGVMGPDTRALGELDSHGQLYHDQLARTIAAFLGFNFKCKNPAGDPIKVALGK